MGYQERLDRLTRRLAEEGLDVELYASAFNPDPFRVSRSHYKELLTLQETVARALEAIVTHYPYDARISDVVALSEPERQLIHRLEGVPFRLGTFRPDFVYDGDGRPRITEINARFPLNGYLSSSLLNRVTSSLYGPEHGLPGLDRLETALRHRLGGNGCIGVVRSSEPGWDIHLLSRWWDDRCETRTPEALTLDDLSRWSAVILELAQSEILERISPPVLEALAVHPGLLNDLRTIFIVHDKRLLSLLSTSAVLDDYMVAPDLERLRAHVTPTWVKGLAPAKIDQAAREHMGWLVKPPRGGKGQGIQVSHHLKAETWARLLRELPDDWILQPFIPQKRFSIARNDCLDESMRVVGLLPALDGEAFGPGMFRASSDDIINVARGGTILAPLLEEE